MGVEPLFCPDFWTAAVPAQGEGGGMRVWALWRREEGGGDGPLGPARALMCAFERELLQGLGALSAERCECSLGPSPTSTRPPQGHQRYTHCALGARPSRGRGRNRAPGPHRNTARQAMDGLWTEVCGQQKQSNDPCNNQHIPQYANYWAPLTRKRHIPPHSAQSQHTNYWAPRTRKRHQQEHRPQRPTESSDPTQHAKGRTGDCPGPRKGATTQRNVTRGAHTSARVSFVRVGPAGL